MMKMQRSACMLLITVCLSTWACALALADDESGHGRYRDYGRHRGGEYKEKYRDGLCKIEREWKRDGGYKEERECQGGREDGGYHRGAEYEEKYWDGPCKVERELKRDGTYKEKRECQGRVQAPRRAPVRVVAPPWIVIEPSGPVYRRGWEPPEIVTAPSGELFRCNRELIGAAIGGVAGGVIGSQIGKGDGHTVATIGGAIAGVLVGGAIGRSMDARDQACIGHALEFAESGRKVTWQDRHTGGQYAVMPGGIEHRAGRYCRPYDADVVIEGKRWKTRGSACRQPDGVWIKES
jgi:surface antigen